MKTRNVDTARLKKGIVNSVMTIASISLSMKQVAAACSAVIKALKSGNKILVAGNGGSALKAATAKRVKTVCLLGRNGGRMKGKGDYEVIVRRDETSHIQEAHQVVLHLILDAVEQAYTVK